MTATTQTFRGPTLRATLTRVKEAMGPAAVILATRERTERHGDAISGYEILASRVPPPRQWDVSNEGEHGAEQAQVLVDTLGALSRSAGRWEAATEALQELRHDVATLASARATPLNSGLGAPPAEIQAMTEAGVDPSLALRLYERACRKSLPSVGLALAQTPSIANEIRTIVRTAPALWNRSGPAVAAMIGATGAGKTTSTVKLAALAAFVHYRRVAMISMDAFRIGHAEQLVAYAELMDIPVRVANSPDGLEAALLAFRDHDLVVIDTPGHAPSDLEGHARTQRWLAHVDRDHRPVSKLLVVNATSRTESMARSAAREETAGVEATVITRMDEVAGLGAMVNVAWATRLPIAHLCHGQSIPDTIGVPNVDALLESLCPQPIP